jgi:cytochrome d ubiquinol oxidase subunit I
VLFIIEMKLMLKAIRKGPDEHPMPPVESFRAEADPELAARPALAPVR